jgi:hypothetical protein
MIFFCCEMSPILECKFEVEWLWLISYNIHFSKNEKLIILSSKCIEHVAWKWFQWFIVKICCMVNWVQSSLWLWNLVVVTSCFMLMKIHSVAKFEGFFEIIKYVWSQHCDILKMFKWELIQWWRMVVIRD